MIIYKNFHLWCTCCKFNNVVWLINILKYQIKIMNCTMRPIYAFILLRNHFPCNHIICFIINDHMNYIAWWTNPFNYLFKWLKQISCIFHNIRSINKFYKWYSLRTIKKEVDECSLSVIGPTITQMIYILYIYLINLSHVIKI